jgi:hypothetical protein
VGLATQAIGGFRTAANADNFAGMCRASGNVIGFVVDSCGGVGFEFANDMCNVYAAAENGDEAKANGDIMDFICREIGWNHYICDSYRTWINWQQRDGKWLTCDWDAMSWGDMCEAVVAEMAWCHSTCNVNIPYYFGAGSCAAVGIARNTDANGADLGLCGWGSSDTTWTPQPGSWPDGTCTLASEPQCNSRNGWGEGCGLHRTGSYCDSDCAEGQGCIDSDCDVLPTPWPSSRRPAVLLAPRRLAPATSTTRSAPWQVARTTATSLR